MAKRSKNNRKSKNLSTLNNDTTSTSNTNTSNCSFNQSNDVHAVSIDESNTDNNNSITNMPILLPHDSISHNFPTHRNVYARLPRFSGDPSELNLFITTLKTYAGINNLNDKQLLFEATQLLDDQAKQLFAQHNEYDPIDSSEKLFNILREHFLSDNNTVHKKNFDSLHLDEGESIRNLAHRINFLTQKVFPEITDKVAINRIKLDKFWNVIPLNLKQQIHFSTKNKDFNEVIKAAIEAESFILETHDCLTTAVPEDCHINSLQAEVKSHALKIDELFEKQNSAILSKEKSKQQNAHQNKYKFKGGHAYHKNHNTHNEKFNQPRFRNRNLPDYKAQHTRFRGSFHGRKPYHRQHNFDYLKTRNYYNNYPPPQVSSDNYTHISMPNNSNQVICQICQIIGHIARDCPNAKIWFDLKDHITPNGNRAH